MDGEPLPSDLLDGAPIADDDIDGLPSELLVTEFIWTDQVAYNCSGHRYNSAEQGNCCGENGQV